MAKRGLFNIVGQLQTPGEPAKDVRLIGQNTIEPTEGYRSQNLSRDSSGTGATLTDDTALNVSFDADTQYSYLAVLRVSSTSATPGFRYAWSLPAGTSVGNFWAHGIETTTGNQTVKAGNFGATNVVLLSGGEATMIVVRGTFSMNVGGVLVMRWAQNVSNATATVLNAGSFQRITRLGPITDQ